MCMEDIRLGRKAYSSVRLVPNNPGVVTTLCVANERRIALSVYNADQDFFLMESSIAVASTSGVNMAANNHPFELTIGQHGQAVTFGYSMFSAAINMNVMVIETFLEEQ